jgi:hypothetical protein
MSVTQDDLTSILIRRKLVTHDQLKGARLLQRQTSGQLHEVLIDFGYATADQVHSAMAELGYSSRRLQPRHPIDLTDVVIPRAIIDLIPESVARECVVIPFAILDGVLHVIMANPDDEETLARLIFILNRDIQPLTAPREQIIDCINRHYGPLKPESVDEVVCEFTDTAIDFMEAPSPAGVTLDDQEDSDFELCLDEESPSRAAHTQVLETRSTQYAMEDAARESMDLDLEIRRSEALAQSAAAAVPRAFRLKSCVAAAAQPMVERQATIRYYHRMSPERMFPLLVIISRKAIMEVIKRDVVQKQSKKFQVEMDSLVEVEPILPGCDCFPPKENVRISKAESTARFWVVPRVLGGVMHARVVVRQNGNVLAEVPLEMVVSKQTLTLFVGAMNFCVPFVSMLLKQSQLSLSSHGEAGVLAALVGWAVLVMSPEVLAGLLLVATVCLYFWLRPKQRDVFWDIRST